MTADTQPGPARACHTLSVWPAGGMVVEKLLFASCDVQLTRPQGPSTRDHKGTLPLRLGGTHRRTWELKPRDLLAGSRDRSCHRPDHQRRSPHPFCLHFKPSPPRPRDSLSIVEWLIQLAGVGCHGLAGDRITVPRSSQAKGEQRQ